MNYLTNKQANIREQNGINNGGLPRITLLYKSKSSSFPQASSEILSLLTSTVGITAFLVDEEAMRVVFFTLNIIHLPPFSHIHLILTGHSFQVQQRDLRALSLLASSGQPICGAVVRLSVSFPFPL